MSDTVWKHSDNTHHPPLRTTVEADIAIIGGGMTGVITAYLLRNSGLRIVLLEKGIIGGVATRLTTAFLVETIDTDLSTLIRLWGQKKSRMIIESHREAIAFYEKTADTEGIACHFMRCPLYLFASSHKDKKSLVQEKEAGKELGIAVELRNDTALPFPQHGSLEIRGQAKFEPLIFLQELMARALDGGVEVFEDTEVIDLHKDDPATLTTTEGLVHAKHVLFATHYPFGDPQPRPLLFKKAKYISYVCEIHLPLHTLPEGLYEDTENPYHYMRLDRMQNHDRLLVGGEDHRADIPLEEQRNEHALEEYVRRMFPNITYAIQRRWKGPIIESGDGLAYIGPLDPESSVFYATGYSGNGMTYAVIAAHMFRDAVQNEPNKYASLYAAKRPSHLKPHFVKAKEYIEQFMRMAVKQFTAVN